MDFKEFITGYKGKVIPKDLKSFNWGACIFTFIWGIKHKAWVTLLAIPLMLIQLPLGLNWLLFALFQLYCGFMGNMWAYQVEWWKKPADFQRTQLKWAISAFLVTLLLPMILCTLIVRFVKKSPDNVLDFVRNTQCVVAYWKIKKGIPSVSFSAMPEDMAAAFAKNFKGVELQDNKVLFPVDADKSKAYFITFDKFSDSACNFVDNNCVITSNYAFSEFVPIAPCVFFVGKNKEIKPDESTQKAIRKGGNIFKYL